MSGFSLMQQKFLLIENFGGMITESGVVFPAQEQAVQSDAKSAENTGKTKKASEKTPVQTPDETAAGASATASENPQLTRYLAQEYGGDWAQTVTPKQLQKAKYRLGLAVTDDPALNTPLYNNLTPDAVQDLKREYGRRWWDKATEEDVLIVQQASLAGKDSAVEGIAQGNDADLEESVKKGSEPLTGNIINRDTSVTGSRKPYITSRPNYGKIKSSRFGQMLLVNV